MKYFKNSELTRLYGVSDKAVRNWVEAAQKNRIGLELIHSGKRHYVADTLQNSFILEDLVKHGQKFRNRRSHQKVSPSNTFYKLYSPKQIIDIALNLDSFHEFPHQYRYSGAGANYWDDYLHKLYRAGRDNTLIDTIQLLETNLDYIKALTTDFKYIEIVDIGVGNGLVVKNFVQHIKETGKLRKYKCIDVSQELLDITEANLRKWCGTDLVIEKHVRDITYERISDVVNHGRIGDSSKNTITIFLFLGGTITNFRTPDRALFTLHDSMSKEDILITSLKLDSERSRRYFDFHIEDDRHGMLPYQDIQALQLLNIEEKFYEPEQFYDNQRHSRFVQIKLKVSLSIHFQLDSFERVVYIPKGEHILLWRIAHFRESDLIAQYEKTSFENLLYSKSKNREYLILISRIKIGAGQLPYKSY